MICLVLERDAKLNELDDRATTLQQGAEMFDRNAGKIQKKFWFQNMKMNFIIGGVAYTQCCFETTSVNGFQVFRIDLSPGFRCIYQRWDGTYI